MFTEYATGTNSFGELQRKATDWGLRTHKGNPVALQTLANILENPFYCGLMRVKGSLYLHAYPALIDRQTFDACQAVRVKPETRQQAVRKTKEDFILRGLVTCAISGRKATCDLKKGRYVYLIVRDPSTPDRKVWVKENVVLDGKLHGVVPTIAAIDLPHHPKQWEAKETKATEVLYGGAAGDGARISTHLEDKLAPEMA